MLVLTRKVGERIHIGDEVVLTVVRIQGDAVRLGIAAPARVVVHREEVARRAREAPTSPPPGAQPCALSGSDDREVH